MKKVWSVSGLLFAITLQSYLKLTLFEQQANRIKSSDITLPTKVHLVKAMVFPVVMDGCKNWTVKKTERQRIDAFELWCWRRLLRVPWTTRRSNQSVLKEIIGRTDAEAETPILWPLDAKNWLIGNDLDSGKDWMQEEKGTIEDEMIGWHHWLNGHEFEQALGVGDGQGSLVCFSLWGCKESDTIDWLNWAEKRYLCLLKKTPNKTQPLWKEY